MHNIHLLLIKLFKKITQNKNSCLPLIPGYKLEQYDNEIFLKPSSRKLLVSKIVESESINNYTL